MSNVATARPLRAPHPAPRPRPHIEIVPTRQQRRARPKIAYAVLTIASLFGIFGAQLLLSIVVSDGAYQLSALQGERKELLRSEQALQERLEVLSSSQNLAGNAAALGMVPSTQQFALNLETGAVFALPGVVDPSGCGGCVLVSNSLLQGEPLVTAPPPPPTAATPGAPPGTVDVLPAPSTH
jgi:hypothetical protein